MSFSVIYPSDKSITLPVTVPIVSDDHFLVAVFEPDKDVVMHGNRGTTVLYRSHELCGSASIKLNYNGSRSCSITKSGLDILHVTNSDFCRNLFNVTPNQFLIDVCYDLSKNVITYTDRFRSQDYLSRYSLPIEGKSKTWKVHLAGKTTIEMPEDRLSRLGWFAMMQTHQCMEMQECTLRLETCTLEMFTCLMRFAECGILMVPFDASLDSLMEIYRTFEFFDVIQGCEYMAEIILCKDNISNATIESLLGDINTHNILRRRFVMLMEWRFTKWIADALRSRAHELSSVIADLFHLIPFAKTSFGEKSFIHPQRRIIVQFDSEDSQADNSNVVEPTVRDYESDTSGLSLESESEESDD